MAGLPPGEELVGLVGLVIGFVALTFGVLGYLAGGSGGGSVLLVAVGSLLGLLSAVYLYLYYRLILIVTGH